MNIKHILAASLILLAAACSSNKTAGPIKVKVPARPAGQEDGFVRGRRKVLSYSGNTLFGNLSLSFFAFFPQIFPEHTIIKPA